MLSKSRILAGYQCEKSLYLQINSPELLPEVSSSQKVIFDQGHEVGLKAQELYPGGVLISAQAYDAYGAQAKTIEAIENGALTIYEATFIHDDIQVRVDILHRDNIHADWEIIEVKSSSGVKEVHLLDLAIQTWVLQGAGQKIKKSSLMHINNQCVHPNLSELFTLQDLSVEIKPFMTNLPQKLASIRLTLSSDKPPKTDIGPHCSDPYECPLRDHCFKHIPETSVFNLPRFGNRVWELYQEGIVELTDPRLAREKLTVNQRRMIQASLTGQRFVDEKALETIKSEWQEPLSYLDFETVSFAIPRYPGTRPYQQIPFQFSLQVETEAELKTYEYLHDEDTDPRLPLIIALIEAVPKSGKIVSYNMSFEGARLREMGEAFPQYINELQSIIERLIDPLPLIRAHVYDLGFKGSFSIKTVAPSLIGNQYSYGNLAISDGSMASESYKELTSGNLQANKKQELRQNMLLYCNQDTMAMVELVNWIRKVIRP